MLGNNTSKVDYRNKRRLVKIHKLKQENRMLASKRKSYYKEVKSWFSRQGNSGNNMAILWLVEINKISEQIGRNSAKIMRLRTLIHQSKIVWNNHKAFFKFGSQFRKNHLGNQFTILDFLNILNRRYKDFQKLNLFENILNGGVNG